MAGGRGWRLGAAGALGLAGLGGLTACGGPAVDKTVPLQDGTYQALSSADEEGAVGQLTITVQGGAVAAAEFAVIQADGTAKDEDYGKDSQGQVANPEYYRAAQQAVAAFDIYAAELVAVGYPQDVDVISGATWAHDQFVEAAVAAMQQAQGEVPDGD
jgi:major membrane immunogen (membrane-anchored lipoprotein)